MTTPNSAAQAATQHPIDEAICLLSAEAESIRECHTPGCDRNDWTGESEAKAAHDNMMRVAAALSKLRAPVASIREGFELTYAADADDPACAADLSHFTNGWRACLMSQVRAPVAPEPFRAAFANGVLPATRFHELWQSAAPSKNSDHTMMEDLAWQVGKFAALVASEVRAPVADERAQDVDLPWLRAYMHHQIASDRWVVTADQARDFARAAVLADRQARDALASAPVADERQAVAYLDLGTGGYVDVGTDLTDKQLAALPKGRHMLAIIGTHGVDGYTTAALASAPVQWPTMPPSKGQSPVLFEDGYAEGWAKCMDECRRAVSQASAPVADEHCSASNPQVFSVEQLEKDPLLVARLWRKPADTDGSLVERIMEHVSEYGESMASSSLLSVRTIARRNLEARIEAELADAMRSQDESPLREALSEIASAWSARTRLPEEDGIQALKDIARAALASAPVADEKPDESNSPVPLAGHSMGPLTPIYDHVGSLIGQALATARHGAYEGSIVWTRMRHAGEWMPWHVAGKQSAPVAGEAQPLGYVLKGREWPNQCYYPSSHKPTDIHNWTPVFDHAAPQASPVAAEAVYTLSVKGVFHNWKPTTAAFSIPDGEHQLFLRPAAPQVSEAVSQPLIARALDEWHEDDGPVTWWAWCGHEWAGEAPWCGTPLDQGWPGYHTHWTPIPGVPAALSAPQASADAFDFVAHLARQAEFSARTFGPGARVAGVCDHIRKELIEVETSGGDLKEWVDVIILGLDGAWRSGATPQEIIAAVVAKQAKNEARTWPDWRTVDPTKAIEHDRGGQP